MFRLGTVTILVSALSFATQASLQGQTPPDFKEVYELLKQNLPGVSEKELQEAAVQGLLSKLGNRVSLLPKGSISEEKGPGLTRTNVFDSSFAYVRIARLDDDVPQALNDAYQRLAAANRIRGVVLDLRYASGDDYSAAVNTIDRFITREMPLAEWGNGLTKSHTKVNAIEVPVVVLVNSQTAGSPELLAELVRRTRTGLILGKRTAGQAAVLREFNLSNGDRLRIATTPIKLGDGSTLPQEGVEPDIPVDVPASDEQAYYADAFTALPTANGASMPAARRTRVNEADLVREHRIGPRIGVPGSRRTSAEMDEPIIYDPALARGLDLLKGLSLVSRPRP